MHSKITQRRDFKMIDKFIKLLKLSEEGMRKQNEGETIYPSDFEFLPCVILGNGTIKELRIKKLKGGKNK